MHRILLWAGLAAARAVPAPASAAGLVALGDSFSSGEGAPPYDHTSGRCRRSAHAWPMRLAFALDLSARPYACSGATIPDLDPQIATLAASNGVRLATLTIGGNDLGFGEVLRNCVLRDCRRLYTRDGVDVIEERIRRLRGVLPGVYRRVERAAPGARLLVMGYPRLFPRRPARFTCAAAGAITPGEIRHLNAKTAAADRAIRAAARMVGAAYVDVFDAFEGGEIRCGGGARYVGRLTFHPTAAGHARLAELALSAIAQEIRDR